MIDIYGKPNCVQCNATYRAIAAKGLVEGVDWQSHDLSLPENEPALEWIMNDLRYSQAPVVYVDDDNHWSGFRPDKITTLSSKGTA